MHACVACAIKCSHIILCGGLICYRSEANDMALRLAKEVTGGTEVIAVDQ